MRAACEGHRALDLEGFSRIVDRVYAAGCAETPWERALEQLCRAGGFSGAALSAVDPLEPWPELRATYGLSERAASAAAPGRMPKNPLLTDRTLRSMPGTVWHDRRIMAPATLAATSFWTEWMQPNRFVSWACVLIGRQGSQVILLEVYSRRQDASTSFRGGDLLSQLAPHLTRAWRLGQTARSAPQPPAAPFEGAAPEEQSAPSPAADAPGMQAVIRLRAEFGLTKAEARLALYLAAGWSLPSMAKAFDVKLTTVRSQLQQVFGKTGTSRQAEVVALLLSHGYAVERQSLLAQAAA